MRLLRLGVPWDIVVSDIDTFDFLCKAETRLSGELRHERFWDMRISFNAKTQAANDYAKSLLPADVVTPQEKTLDDLIFDFGAGV